MRGAQAGRMAVEGGLEQAWAGLDAMWTSPRVPNVLNAIRAVSAAFATQPDDIAGQAAAPSEMRLVTLDYQLTY